MPDRFDRLFVPLPGRLRSEDVVRSPADESFHGVVLRQAEPVVQIGGVSVTVLGSFPELAVVRWAREHGFILLTLVHEDGLPLLPEVFGGQWHRLVDFMRCPFLPCATVEPDVQRLRSITATSHGSQDGVGADAVGPVWIGEITCEIDVMGLDLG